MNTKLPLCLALGFMMGFAGEQTVLAYLDITQISSTNISDFPVSVQVTNGDFGECFTVFYKTNMTTTMLHGELHVCSEDHQIASCIAERNWTTNGVQFEFTISPKYVTASSFSIADMSRVAGSGSCYWFFAMTNPGTNQETRNTVITPAILKALPKQIQTLHPGMTANQVWEKLFHRPYRHYFSGVGYPGHERWWLTWNYEAEFYFQPPPTNRPFFAESKRKLIRAVLYKNGKVVGRSGK